MERKGELRIKYHEIGVNELTLDVLDVRSSAPVYFYPSSHFTTIQDETILNLTNFKKDPPPMTFYL